MSSPTLPFTTVNQLPKYTGEWTFETAAHLLRRAMFGPTLAQIQWSVEQGMEATLDKLFKDEALPDPPINTSNPEDRFVDLSDTWINAPYSEEDTGEELGHRDRSLSGWTLKIMVDEGMSIREKMTLFWHNHFPIASVEDAKFNYRYINTLRSYAFGNFREMTKAITVDPAMLIYLNGKQNTRERPNENYARELLELFTIGKGPLIAPGDYSTYTEHDVKELARILSGFKNFGFAEESTDGTFGSRYEEHHHDIGRKELSYHFDHAVFENEGEQEHRSLIDLIFTRDEVAHYICRKWYQWFVYYKIDDEVEQDVIAPLAQQLIDENYEIKGVIRSLLSSEFFYREKYFGVMIKNPIDFVMSIFKSFEMQLDIPGLPDVVYDSYYRLHKFLELMQMDYFGVPEVAGWKAYYGEPLFYRNWVNASTLPIRMQFSDDLAYNGLFPFQANGPQMYINVLRFTENLENNLDPNEVVQGYAKQLFPRPLRPEQHDRLKAILLPGLPDFEWTVEYGDYLSDPNNDVLREPIEEKLRILVKTMLTMPEFYLS